MGKINISVCKYIYAMYIMYVPEKSRSGEGHFSLVVRCERTILLLGLRLNLQHLKWF